MQAWIQFWTLFLVLGLSVFALVSAVVAVGGLRDLRRLFRQLAEREAEDRSD